MRFVVRVGRLGVFVAASIIAACSVGNTQSQTTTSSSSISFAVASPDAATPPSQTFSATVSPGTVSLAVLHSGSAIANVTYTLSGTTAQIVVYPASPATLGAGLFSGRITVTGYTCSDAACSTLVSGNTQIVSVAYQVPPIVRYVAPYVGFTNITGSVIIRGQGFLAFPVQNVLFNGTPASSFSVVSDTEIQASYPGLPAASYPGDPVQITVPSDAGTVTSSANLAIVNPTGYNATTLPYPVTVTAVKKVVYDAANQDLVVAATTSAGDEVMGYQYSNGAWSSTPTTVAAPASAPDNNISDIALSTDGQYLLVLSQQHLAQLTPVTFSSGTITLAPTLPTGSYFKNLAVANDGNAVVTTGYPTSSTGSQSTPLYQYAARNPGFSQVSSTPSLDNATPGASLDGSVVALEQGDSTLTTAPSAYQYLAASQTFGATSAAINQGAAVSNQNVIPPALDQSATIIVLNGSNVYDGNYNLLGTLAPPSGDLPVGVVVSPDGKSAYMYDSAGQISSFNLQAGATAGVFSPVTTVAAAGSPGNYVSMTISPDGNTLFLAGTGGIVIQPPP